MVTISPIDHPEPVMELFMHSNLEVTPDEFVDRLFLKGYKAETEDGTVIGGCALTVAMGHYIINGIAVEPEFRKTHIASELLANTISDAREMGAKEIILVARAPGFFRKNHFVNVPEAEIPQGLFDCLECPQYQSECFPEIMKLPL